MILYHYALFYIHPADYSWWKHLAFDLSLGFTRLWLTDSWIFILENRNVGKSWRQKLEVRCLWLSLCSQMCTLIWNRVFQNVQMYNLTLAFCCSFTKCDWCQSCFVYCATLESLRVNEPEKQPWLLWENWLENIVEVRCKYQLN